MTSNDIYVENLNKLRLCTTGCDIVFEVGPRSFFAHRAVLMARMEFFRKKLTVGMGEKSNVVIPLNPQVIDPTYFGELLNYIYTLKIDFRNDNLRALLRAAEYFCFDELTIEIEEYMTSNFGLDNVVLYKNIAQEFGLKSFGDEHRKFIIQHILSDVNRCFRAKLTPCLSLEDLEEIIQELRINGRLEDVFHYSVDWILCDKTNRSRDLPKLLKKIPLQDLSFYFLKEVVSKNDLIRQDKACVNMLIDTIITLPNCREDGTNKDRVEILYAIGGIDDREQISSSVTEYNSLSRKWTATTSMPSKRTHFSCTVIGHKIYVCGGFNKEGDMNSLIVFDTFTRIWSQLTPMKHARQLCGMAVLDGQIYVAGGATGDDQLAVVERYCVKTDQWQEVAPLNTKQSHVKLVPVFGFLYVFGGRAANNALTSVERYDPQTDQWTQMNSMSEKFYCLGSAILNDKIYVLGATRGEVYNPADDTWTDISGPVKWYLGIQMAVYNEKLYVFGGDDDENKKLLGLKRVEVFDNHVGVWRPEPEMEMNVGRCFHAVAVVKS